MTLSFACKQIDLKDILMCSFELNKTEYALLLFLLKQKESLCASTIGELTKKDRTTIQKAVKKLVRKDIVAKHQVNLDGGGYTFVYSIKNKELLRSKVLDIVNGWHTNVIDAVSGW